MARFKYTPGERCEWVMIYNKKTRQLSPMKKSRCPNEATQTINGKRYCRIHAQYVPDRSLEPLVDQLFSAFE